MDNGKHFSPSNGQQPMPPKPVVPATRRSTPRRGTHAKSAGSSRQARTGLGPSGTPRVPRQPRRFKSWRSAAAAVLAPILVMAGIAGVIAWTVAQDSLTNAFEIGTVDPVIEETFNPQPSGDGNVVKENVFVKNQGKADIYVRARVNVYWIDSAGNQLWEEPQADTDYTVSYPNPMEWVTGSDGYYFWTNKIACGGSTEHLIDSISQNDGQIQADGAAGRKLVVDIDIQGIQAGPADAVSEAWGVSVDEDGTLNVNGGGE